MIAIIKDFSKDKRLFDFTISVLIQCLNGNIPTILLNCVNQRDADIFYRLLNDISVSKIAERHGINVATCNKVAEIYCDIFKEYLIFVYYPSKATSLKSLFLSTRSYNALHRAGFKTVSDVVNYYKTYKSFKNVKNLGIVSEREIVLTLARRNIFNF